MSPALAGGFFYHCTAWEAQIAPYFAIEKKKGFKGLTLPVIAVFTAVSHVQPHFLVLSPAPEGIRVHSP